MRVVLAGIPPRRGYYPGAAERWQAYAAAHPRSRAVRQPREGELPWLLAAGLDPRQRGRHLLHAGGVLLRGVGDRARRRRSRRVPRTGSRVRQRHALGHAQRRHHRPPRVAARPGGRGRGGAGDRGPALRHRLGEPVGRRRLRRGHHPVGRLRRERHLRRPVGDRRGAQHADVLAGAEERDSGPVPRLAGAAVVPNLPQRPGDRPPAHRSSRPVPPC